MSADIMYADLTLTRADAQTLKVAVQVEAGSDGLYLPDLR